MYIPVSRRSLPGVRPEPHIVDWMELVGTWALVGLVALGVWFDWKMYQRGGPSWLPKVD